MATQFTLRQLNNLQVGNALAAEIPPLSVGKKAFDVVTPYHADPRPVVTLGDRLRRRRFSNVLNADPEHDVRYTCAVFEVEESVLETYLDKRTVSDSAHLDRTTRSDVSDLATIPGLEAEVLRHMEDLAPLDVSWRVLPWG